MQDLISRQAAIDEVNRLAEFFWEKWHEYAPSTIAVTDALKEIPSAQQWIPCSERMPECDYTDVLICVHDKRKGCEKDYYIISAYTSGKHWEPTLAVDMTDLYVDAWMPLPEPYKEEQT